MTRLDFDFNNVKVEKAAAMRRYNRQKKLKSFLFLVEVLAALALLLWYSTCYVPVVSDVAADFLRRSVVIFGRSLYVFFIINVLVVVIFALSFQKPSKPDFHDEYVSITTTKPTVSGRRASSYSADDHSPAHNESVTNTVGDRRIVCLDNAVHNPPAEQSIVSTMKTAPPPPYPDHESRLAVSSVRQSRVGHMTETRKYSRTRSERYGKKNRPELRRSETVIKREITMVEGEEPRRSSSAMDDLSSEEFRWKIDTFIADKKKSLIRENKLDLNQLERKERVSITVKRFN